MTWVLIGLGVLLLVVLVRSAGGGGRPQTHGGGGRGATGARAVGTGAVTAPGLLGAEVLRRATDPNDPDGAFMDGYVSGRLTERWSTPDPPRDSRAPERTEHDGRWRADDEGDDLDDAHHDDPHGDLHGDPSGYVYRDLPGDLYGDVHDDLHADPDDW